MFSRRRKEILISLILVWLYVTMMMVIATVLIAVIASPAKAQALLPFRSAIIVIDRSEQRFMRDAYRSVTDAIGNREIVYCVTSWSVEPLSNGIDRVTVHKLELQRMAERNQVAGVEGLCRDENGIALPMIHSHSNTNCQASPADILTTAVREAPFDGIQCGESHVMWLFAWQYRSILNHLTMDSTAATAANKMMPSRP